jgi:Tfp pilus assembly protein PilF
VSQDFQEIMQKGVAAAKTGNREEASEFFRRATEINPNDIRGWLYWARVTSNTQQAKAAVKRALEIDPGNSQAQQMLATLGGNGLPSRARPQYNKPISTVIFVSSFLGSVHGYFLFSSDKSESSASKVEAIPPTATFTPTLTFFVKRVL